jgi:hypothetical protein
MFKQTCSSRNVLDKCKNCKWCTSYLNLYVCECSLEWEFVSLWQNRRGTILWEKDKYWYWCELKTFLFIVFFGFW